MKKPFHPLHAVLLSGTVPLFMGALLSDIAYTQTYEIQWKNFASWLIVGGLVFGGFALLAALIDIPRIRRQDLHRVVYPVLLLLGWVLGFINAFVHAGDAWASVPAGPVLSAIVALLAVAATALGFHRRHLGAVE